MSPKTIEQRWEAHDEGSRGGTTEAETSGPRIRSVEQMSQDTRRAKMIKAATVAIAAVVIVGGGAWAGAGAASDGAGYGDGSGAQPPAGKLAVPDDGNLHHGAHPRGLPRRSGLRRRGEDREARGESGSPHRPQR